MLLDVADHPGQVLHYVNDLNGCPIRLVDEGGRVCWAASYSAWGKAEQLHARDIDNPIRLQGQYEDAETGLHYNRHRYFDGSTGMFVSRDPLGLTAGENLFAMGPNGMAWIDPLGLSQTYWLEQSLTAAGRPLAPGQTAHHIVQQNNPSAFAGHSRNLLARNGLSPEIAENGARLWGTASSQVGVTAHPGRVQARGLGNYHAGPHIHSPMNDQLIYRILRRAEQRGGADGVRSALAEIGRRMESGNWQRAFKGCGG